VLCLQTVDELRAQSVRASKKGHINHPWNDDFGDVGCEVAGIRRCRRRVDKRLFLNPYQSTIEVEQLPGKALAPAQYSVSPAPAGPQTIGRQRGRLHMC